MDEFSLERPELAGSLITMHFGTGGRIEQLWGADPNLPDNSEELQFVLPPVSLGDEYSEDYNPGTILIGARLSPEDPWMVSRNAEAELLSEPGDPQFVEYRYDFGLLPEVDAVGSFREMGGPVPGVSWELRLRNAGRKPLEIGELGFPLALNNLYEGQARTEEGLRQMMLDRCFVHPFIGGAGSFIFAQRMTADPPALLVIPGNDTVWEFCNHVPASLNTPYRWEGIPVVYVHSRAAIEREGWREWFGGHSSVVLEPGDERTYTMQFVPCARGGFDGVFATLEALRRPSIRLYPSAVVPVGVGIGVEVGGATPLRFVSQPETELETDSDEEGGFCYLEPTTAGPVALSFDDTEGRTSHAHLIFTQPIDELIQARARWIMEHQLHQAPGSNLHGAIVPANLVDGSRLTDPELFAVPFGIDGSLSDALYLAEKNTLFPDRDEIAALDEVLSEFVQDDLQNPGDGSVGSILPGPDAIAVNLGRAHTYGLILNLYHAMYRVARGYGETRHSAESYLDRAARTLQAMFRNVAPNRLRTTGVPSLPYVYDLLADLRREGRDAIADELSELVDERSRHLVLRSFPSFGETTWDPAVFADLFAAARRQKNESSEELAVRMAFVGRSLAPCWWWYGSDKRWLDESESPHPAMADKGEMCLGPTGPANSLMLFSTLDRDYAELPDSMLRLAFGGMLGIWALVRPDGAASMGFCPDAASRQYGTSALTGDVGLSLFHYLRGVASYVLPGRGGVATFGCRLDSFEDGGSTAYSVRPWDGVGRRVVVRQLGLEVSVRGGRIREFRFDARKRWADLTVENPSDKDLTVRVELRGLWGNRFMVGGLEAFGENGVLETMMAVAAGKESKLEVRVIL